MKNMQSPFELYNLLEKSNCRECSTPSCMAFAALVLQGQKKLKECPYVGEELLEQFEEKTENPEPVAGEDLAAELKKKICAMDFQEAAGRLGGLQVDDKIEIKCLGKSFYFDNQGDLTSQCHTHFWLKGPMLAYFAFCEGVELSGKWVLLKELNKGNDWDAFFNKRCIQLLKKMADESYQLFTEVVSIFGEEYKNGGPAADLSMILYPLPRLPFLICYNKPEDGFESSLNVFFDSSADKNLDVEPIYTLGVGMAIMFDKFIRRHGSFQIS